MGTLIGAGADAVPQAEIERRYARIREAMARDGLDAVIVSGNEYSGFEGAVTYMSGFVIVHRYAYVLLSLEGDPAIVFPREARYVGEHGTTWIEQQEFVDLPGEWLADQVRGKRVGVYGLDYVMTVRDYRALDGAAEIVSWDLGFDHARAVKSEFELASVRESVRINTEGFWRFLEAFEVGKAEREILAPCEEYFVSQGCGRLTMDMVLVGEDGAALPARVGTGSRSRAQSAPARRAPSRSECSRPTTSTTPRRARFCTTVRPPTTHIARSPRASPTAAGRSVMSPATRSA